MRGTIKETFVRLCRWCGWERMIALDEWAARAVAWGVCAVEQWGWLGWECNVLGMCGCDSNLLRWGGRGKAEDGNGLLIGIGGRGGVSR